MPSPYGKVVAEALTTVRFVIALAAATGGSARVDTFVATPAVTSTRERLSPIVALFPDASLETGTSRTKFTPEDGTGSVIRDEARTVPFEATACITASASEVSVSCLKSSTLPV